MPRLKYKYFAATSFFILLAGQLLLMVVSPVSANHDSCSDISPQVYLRCEDSRRTAAQERCFESNAGNNSAIESCVGAVDAHFNYTGSGDAPGLPPGALPEEPAAVIKNPFLLSVII